MKFIQRLAIILFPYAIKIFKKVLKKAGLPYGAESYVEIKGFLARHYDTLLDLATVGFYKNFIPNPNPNPNCESLTRLKSFSGIKSTTALNSYLGTAKKEQQKAIECMSRKYE